jgi:hypothetical protein
VHVESLENCGGEGLLANTDARAVFIAVDLDAKDLPCCTKVHDLVILRKHRLDLHCCVGGTLHMNIHHEDVINVQNDENAIAADIEVRIGLCLCESEEEEEDVAIVMTKQWCLFELVRSIS